jgi:hypothetical protein
MTDYPVILTLMLHEAAHILLDEQPRDLGWEIQSWFEANPARSSQYAKGLMQESWATAVANGFLREQLTGTLSSGSWYGQKYIDQMAKKLLPLLRPYLSTGKPMDRALVDAYVDIYEHTFLEWLSEWGNLMTGRAVISERPEDFDLLDRKFPYRNAQKYLRDFSDESLGQLRDSRMTKLLIVSRDNAAALARIRRFFPELADWRPDPAVDFTYSVLATDKTRLIVVNLVTGSLESQFNVPLAPLSSRVSPRLEDPMDVMTVNLARGCQHVTPISPSDLTSRLASLAGSGQRVAGVAMISLNANMNRRISSAVPTDTRRCSFIGGKGRPTRMSFF